jgi:hypothetical protein
MHKTLEKLGFSRSSGYYHACQAALVMARLEFKSVAASLERSRQRDAPLDGGVSRLSLIAFLRVR